MSEGGTSRVVLVLFAVGTCLFLVHNWLHPYGFKVPIICVTTTSHPPDVSGSGARVVYAASQAECMTMISAIHHNVLQTYMCIPWSWGEEDELDSLWEVEIPPLVGDAAVTCGMSCLRLDFLHLMPFYLHNNVMQHVMHPHKLSCEDSGLPGTRGPWTLTQLYDRCERAFPYQQGSLCSVVRPRNQTYIEPQRFISCKGEEEEEKEGEKEKEKEEEEEEEKVQEIEKRRRKQESNDDINESKEQESSISTSSPSSPSVQLSIQRTPFATGAVKVVYSGRYGRVPVVVKKPKWGFDHQIRFIEQIASEYRMAERLGQIDIPFSFVSASQSVGLVYAICLGQQGRSWAISEGPLVPFKVVEHSRLDFPLFALFRIARNAVRTIDTLLKSGIVVCELTRSQFAVSSSLDVKVIDLGSAAYFTTDRPGQGMPCSNDKQCIRVPREPCTPNGDNNDNNENNNDSKTQDDDDDDDMDMPKCSLRTCVRWTTDSVCVGGRCTGISQRAILEKAVQQLVLPLFDPYKAVDAEWGGIDDRLRDKAQQKQKQQHYAHLFPSNDVLGENEDGVEEKVRPFQIADVQGPVKELLQASTIQGWKDQLHEWELESGVSFVEWNQVRTLMDRLVIENVHVQDEKYRNVHHNL